MLGIHKEGIMMILGTTIVSAIIGGLTFWLAPTLFPYISIVLIGIFILVVQFFRNPRRTIDIMDDSLVYAPADGKVVVIEEAIESEYFKDKRLQVSIFMNPLNVHVNRNPIGGIVKYFKYHEGKYLVAWHPKSSSENERTTLVIRNNEREILLRQIAGALARRIVAYVKEGDVLTQGGDFGFIKFGSRVDLFLPLNTQIEVKLEEKVVGNKTVIAKLK
jgi:phosphatidylserine decarboxylase